MQIPAFVYMLAPMEGITTPGFRAMCRRYGADLAVTEMATIGSLARANGPALKRIDIPDGSPTVIQIIGQREEELKVFLDRFVPKEGFAGFNLNLGCPSPNFLSAGLGAAMIKRVSKTKRLADMIAKKGHPVSIKMRLGINAYEKERKAYLNLIKGVDADMFIVHARHGGERLSDRADWKVLPECIATGKPIVANGDIRAPAAVKRLREMGVRGVMVGREAVRNPAIFARFKGIAHPAPERIRAEFEELHGAFPAYSEEARYAEW